MIFVILSWLYIGIFSYLIGFYGNTYLNRLFGNTYSDIWWLNILGGLCYLSIFNTILSLFIPISLTANIIVWVILTTCIFFNPKPVLGIIKPFKEFDTLSWLIFLCAFAVCLVESTDWADMHDEYMYYQPSIRWIQEYKAILGLANLHGKLGFGSTWFILSAFFNFSFLGFDFLNELNGLVVLVLVVYSLESIRKVYKNKSILLSDVVACLFPGFLIWLYLKHISGSNVDLPTSIMIWIVFNELLKKFENNRLFEVDPIIVVLIIISYFIITAKLSQVAILIIPIFYLLVLAWNKAYQKLSILVFLGFLIIVPWLARNVIHTGYIIYPLSTIDLFNFDWEVPKVDYPNATGCCQSVQSEKNIVLFHSRGLLEGPVEEKLQKPLSFWLPEWLKTITKFDIAIIIMYIFSMAALCAYIIYNFLSQGYYKAKQLIIFCFLTGFTCLLSIAIWYSNGPSIRYAYSFLCYPIFLAIAFLLKKIILIVLI